MSPNPIRLLLHTECDDFDALFSQVRHWQIDLKKIDRGPFQGFVFQLGIGQVLLGGGGASTTMSMNGGSPSGMRSFLISAPLNQRFRWCSQSLTGKEVAVMPGNLDFQATLSPGVRNFTYAFSDEHLAKIADSMGLPGPDDLFRDQNVFHCDERSIVSIASELTKISDVVKRSPESMDVSHVHHMLNHELPRLLLEQLARDRPVRVTLSGSKQARALRLSEAFLHEATPEELTVDDLLGVTEVSQRTLQYAFLKAYGVTPKAFLLSLRLNGAYRELLVTNPSRTKVSEVANAWEFWHMGQFAADYKKLFGELPSETLLKKG